MNVEHLTHAGKSVESPASILQLTGETLANAATLADRTFHYVTGTKPSESIASYLDKTAYSALYPERTPQSQFFVAEKNVGGEQCVVGTIGIYEMKHDAYEASYVGWFCVSPSARGTGIGTKLLARVIAEARRQGKKYLRLDTSTHPAEESANRLYIKYGFVQVKDNGVDIGSDGIECRLIDLELEL
jgi:GNAT superfamily N-acetyltransferase